MSQADSEWAIGLDGGRDELLALLDWFGHDDELRGRVRLASAETDVEQMGDLYDVLTVAVGAGGIASALAGSLTTWLVHRRSDIKVTLRRAGDGTVIELDAARVASPEIFRELRELLDPPNHQRP